MYLCLINLSIIVTLLGQSSLFASELANNSIERDYPEVGLQDTCIFTFDSIQNLKVQSLDKDVDFFSDEEIHEVHQIARKGLFNEQGLAIMQQPSRKGCSIGVTQMLIKDQGKSSRHLHLSRNLGTFEDIKRDLKLANISSKLIAIPELDDALDKLFSLLSDEIKSSIILQVTDFRIGQHFIILDQLFPDENLARIRDPYHGWDITVYASALLQRLKNETILQVEYL